MSDNTSTSGVIHTDKDSVNPEFTEMSVLDSAGYNLLVKAKRYGRWWILKGLKEEYRAQSIYQTMLHKEFDIMIQLQHQNIVSVIGFEYVADIGQCIIMEWIDGITLKDWLQESHSHKERLRVSRQLIDALQYAHELQIAHRDLKPSNVMITHNGQNVKLIDFGLSDTDSHAVFKQPAGTEGYMAPELKNIPVGHAVETYRETSPDARADIYSLGCILDELQLGWLYRKVVNKCCAPRNRRYENVESLEASIRHCEILPRIFFIAFAIGLFSVVLFAIGLNLNRGKMDETVARTQQYEKKADAALVEAQKIPSSLKDSLSELKQVNHVNAIKSKRTNDSLHNRIKELEQQTESVNDKEEYIKKSIAQGKVMIDKIVGNFDRKIRNGYPMADYASGKFTNEYMKTFNLLNSKIESYSHGLKLSDLDSNHVKNTLYDYSAKYTNRWVKFINDTNAKLSSQ